MFDESLARTMEEVTLRRRAAHVFDKLVGEASRFVDVKQQLLCLADSAATVLIIGETGTGKELLARAVHYLSSRAGFPFIAVNCAALPDTLLEDELFGHERGAYTDAHAPRQGLIAKAHQGTLFLDEVESLSPRGQGVLLRVLQERMFRALGSTTDLSADVRFVASTNVDLDAMVRQSLFRRDLFYRLRVLWLEMPALRDRREDIPLLTRHFLAKHVRRNAAPATLSREAQKALLDWDWPGNVRELENALIRAMHLAEGGTIEPHHLGLQPARPEKTSTLTWLEDGELSLKESKRRLLCTFEREYLTRVLTDSRGNVTQAALRAKKDRRELGKLLRKYGINAKDFARGA